MTASEESLRLEGNKLFKRKDYLSAMTKYCLCLKQNPDNIKALANRALVLMKMERFEKAVADCDAVLRLQPDHTKALFRKARACRRIGRYEDAEKAFIACIASSDGSSASKQTAEKEFQSFLRWRSREVSPGDEEKKTSSTSRRMRMNSVGETKENGRKETFTKKARKPVRDTLVVKTKFARSKSPSLHPAVEAARVAHLQIEKETEVKLENEGKHKNMPSAEHQRFSMKRALSQQKGNEQLFAIHMDWWLQWCAYTNYNSDKNFISSRAPPRGIDNSKIANFESREKNSSGKKSAFFLRSDCIEDRDYKVVTETAWDMLNDWYPGGVGPSVKIEIDVAKKKIVSNSNSGDKNSLVQCDLKKSKGSNSELIRCSACGRFNALNRCSRCKVLRYCGKSCQLSHWEFHKNYCKKVQLNTNDEENVEENATKEMQREYRGRVGLRNLGNTCFMNSTLQCLSHTYGLTEFFLSNQYLNDLNDDKKQNLNGTAGMLALQYGQLLKRMWFGSSYSSSAAATAIAPHRLKMAIAKFAPMFSGYSQHDSHELLIFLIDGLHEDLNRVRNKEYVELRDDEGRPDHVVAAESRANHCRRNSSKVDDLFLSFAKSTLVCPDCNRVSITFDPQSYISLQLASASANRGRVLYVFVQKRDGSDPVRYGIRVPKQSGTSVRLLQDKIAEYSHLCLDEFYLADVFEGKIYQEFTEKQSVDEIQKDDRIVAYELVPENSFYLFVRHAIETNQSDEYKHWGADPLLLSFNSSTSEIEIRQEILKYISKKMFFKNLSSSEDRKHDDSDDNDDEDLLHLQLHVGCRSTGKISRIIDTFGESDEEGSALERLKNVKFTRFKNQNDKFFNLDLLWSNEMIQKLDKDRLKSYIDDSSVEKERKRSEELQKERRKGLELSSLLRLYSEKEKLDTQNLWYCNCCKDHVPASKQLQLWSLPKVLVIQLKRFQFINALRSKKIDTFVDFPLSNLDMKAFMLPQSPCNESTIYDLYAVSNHFGRIGFGHYTAFARRILDGERVRQFMPWYNFDDSSVTRVESEDEIITPAAYILFYQQRPKNITKVEFTKSKE
eukprot:g5933.t1